MIFNLKTKSKFRSYKTQQNEGILNLKFRKKKALIDYYSNKVFGIGVLINYVFNLFFPFLNLGIRNYLIYKINLMRLTKCRIHFSARKNEEGNMEELISRVPNFKYTKDYYYLRESRDKTYEKSIEIKNKYKNILKFKAVSNGKANAIWKIRRGKYELIAILDSDLSVDPETLHIFLKSLNLEMQILKSQDYSTRWKRAQCKL